MGFLLHHHSAEIDIETNNYPSPLRGCVVIVMEGGLGRNRQSGSSALECGRLKAWAIGFFRNGILFMGLEPRSGAMKGFRSKASSPDRLFRVGTEVLTC
jgi:hypothetical protein